MPYGQTTTWLNSDGLVQKYGTKFIPPSAAKPQALVDWEVFEKENRSWRNFFTDYDEPTYGETGIVSAAGSAMSLGGRYLIYTSKTTGTHGVRHVGSTLAIPSANPDVGLSCLEVTGATNIAGDIIGVSTGYSNAGTATWAGTYSLRGDKRTALVFKIIQGLTSTMGADTPITVGMTVTPVAFSPGVSNGLYVTWNGTTLTPYFRLNAAATIAGTAITPTGWAGTAGNSLTGQVTWDPESGILSLFAIDQAGNTYYSQASSDGVTTPRDFPNTIIVAPSVIVVPTTTTTFTWLVDYVGIAQEA